MVLAPFLRFSLFCVFAFTVGQSCTPYVWRSVKHFAYLSVFTMASWDGLRFVWRWGHEVTRDMRILRFPFVALF